jgi:phage shock protein C
MEPKRLYRSLTDHKIAGVAGGLAEYFDTDPLLLRLAFVVLALAGGGGVLIYIILWVITPEKPFSSEQFNSHTSSGSSPDPGFTGTSNPFNSHATEGSSPDPGSTTPSDPFKSQDPFKTSDPFKSPDPFKTPKPSESTTKGKGSLIGGLILITLGTLFLINQLVPNIDFGDLWPILLVVIGAGLLINAVTGRK